MKHTKRFSYFVFVLFLIFSGQVGAQEKCAFVFADEAESKVIRIKKQSAPLIRSQVFPNFYPREGGEARHQRNRYLKFLFEFASLKERHRGNKALVKLSEDYLAEVQRDLAYHGVDVQVLDYPNVGVHARALFIREDSNSSPLNRMAGSIWKRYRARLMYAPFELANDTVKGYVVSHKGVIFYSLSNEMIATLKPDINFLHEMIHVRMDYLDQLGSAHVFLTEYFSTRVFDNAGIAGYDHYFRQDELLAFNKQIVYVAAKYKSTHPRFFKDLVKLTQKPEMVSKMSKSMLAKEQASQASDLGQALNEHVNYAILVTEEAYNFLSELPMLLEIIDKRPGTFANVTANSFSTRYSNAKLDMEVWHYYTSVKIQIDEVTMEFRIPNRHAQKSGLTVEDWKDAFRDLSIHVNANLKEVKRNRDLLGILAKGIDQKDIEVILDAISALRRDI